MLTVLAIMAMMAIPALATDGTAATAPKDSLLTGKQLSTGLSTATGGSDGNVWYYENDDDAIDKSLDKNGADIDVWAITSQTDTYAVTIEWGDMTFHYGFGTWNPVSHAWDAIIGWTALDFDGTKDQVKVTNNSSQGIIADFSYLADIADGATNTGIFTKASAGNSYNTGNTTGPMTIAAFPFGATALSGATYINLQGRPAAAIPALIGATAKKIGTITVTISV